MHSPRDLTTHIHTSPNYINLAVAKDDNTTSGAKVAFVPN